MHKYEIIEEIRLKLLQMKFDNKISNYEISEAFDKILIKIQPIKPIKFINVDITRT